MDAEQELLRHKPELRAACCAQFGWNDHLAGATVTIDGETVVEGGNLKEGSPSGY